MIFTKIKRLNNKGSALVLGMGMVLISLIFAYVIGEFATTNAIITHIRDTGQAALDSYTIETGREVMNSIKSGHDYTQALKAERFLNRYEKELGVQSLYTGHSSDGKLLYRIKDMKTEFIYTDTLKTKADFIVTYQFYFMSTPLFTSDFHIKLASHYNIKNKE